MRTARAPCAGRAAGQPCALVRPSLSRRSRRPSQLRPSVNGLHEPSAAQGQAVSEKEAGGAFVPVPGLREFASSVWDRQQRIPGNSYNDPLQRLFEEFDADGDGSLTAAEVAAALQSRGVELSEPAAQAYIDAVDLDGNRCVERSEFGTLIFQMAAAEMNERMPRPLKRTTTLLQRTQSQIDASVFRRVLEADPTLERIPGLQRWAASVRDRQRHVPAQLFQDPLRRVFEEFDADGDGSLTAAELVAALADNGVELTEAQAQLVVDAVDTDGNGTIEESEFPALIMGLASLDRA